MATIFKSMGYEAIFFARIHMDDEKRRKAEKALEMFWQGSKNLGIVFVVNYMKSQGKERVKSKFPWNLDNGGD